MAVSLSRLLAEQKLTQVAVLIYNTIISYEDVSLVRFIYIGKFNKPAGDEIIDKPSKYETFFKRLK